MSYCIPNLSYCMHCRPTGWPKNLAHLCLLVFSCCFLDTDISKGSVATHLRCGGIFSDSIITNFILIPTAKKFENWSILDEVIRRTKKCAKFLGYPVCDAWLTNRAGFC